MKHVVTHAIVAAAVAFALPATARAQQSDQDKMKDKAMMHDEMAMALAKGTFVGADKHLASGSYEIVSVDGNHVLRTSADLSVDPGAPDVYVVLSSSATVGKKDGVWLGKLGSQNAVPLMKHRTRRERESGSPNGSKQPTRMSWMWPARSEWPTSVRGDLHCRSRRAVVNPWWKADIPLPTKQRCSMRCTSIEQHACVCVGLGNSVRRIACSNALREWTQSTL